MAQLKYWIRGDWKKLPFRDKKNFAFIEFPFCNISFASILRVAKN
jgi:hypothetical protein